MREGEAEGRAWHARCEGCERRARGVWRECGVVWEVWEVQEVWKALVVREATWEGRRVCGRRGRRGPWAA